jgi:hypothetical protein
MEDVMKKIKERLKRKKEKFFVGLLVVITGAFLSLGWQHHQVRPFNALAQPLLPSALDPQEKGVEVQVKLLSSGESEQLLGHDLLKRDIQPLHFTIHNNSPNAYSLSREGVELTQIEAKKVAKKLYRLTLPRAVAFKVISFLFWPFTIPSTIDSVHSYYSYKQMRKDFELKSLKEELLPVYATFHRILFVPSREMKERFNMTMIDEEKQEPLVLTIQQSEEAISSN